jgi:hypothetical protein
MDWLAGGMVWDGCGMRDDKLGRRAGDDGGAVQVAVQVAVQWWRCRAPSVGNLSLAKYKCLLPIRDAPGKLE